MNLSSLFPTANTLGAKAVAKATAAPSDVEKPKTLEELTRRRKPGEFKIAWPRMRTQGVKDYQTITTAADLIAYIQKCEATGLGGFDYETTADREERRRFAEYATQNRRAREAAADDPKEVGTLEKEYEKALKEHQRTPLDPHKAEVCAMSLAANPDEARAIFIDNPGRRQFEPTLNRDEARALLMDTLERHFFTNTRIMKIAVNLAFESKFTAKYGKYLLMPVADPMLAWIRVSQLVLPQRIKNPKKPFVGKGLKTMTKETFGVIMTTFDGLLDKHGAAFFSDVPCDSQDAVSYCCEDSDYAVQHYLYWDEIAKQIENENDVYPTYSDWLKNIEMPFARVTGLMEYWGMYWDSDVADVKRQEARIAQEEAAAKIAQIAKDVTGRDINVGVSGRTNDVSDVIFKDLKVPVAVRSTLTKEPSLDRNAVMDTIFMLENKLIDLDEEKYLGVELPANWESIDADTDPTLDKATRQRVRIAQRAEHPYKDQAIELLRQLQRIQKYSTLLSSHIEGREKYVNERTGRIHAQYEPWTETSRLASSNPKPLGPMLATA